MVLEGRGIEKITLAGRQNEIYSDKAWRGQRRKREAASGQRTKSRKGGREGERDGPRDAGSATAGCYVSAPPALSPHGLSRLRFSPIPHSAAAAHFFFAPSTHMAPHMAASLPPPLPSSITLSPSLSLTLLHPLIAPQGSHQPLLSLCLSPPFCFFVCLPLPLSLFPSILFHPLSFSLSLSPVQ